MDEDYKKGLKTASIHADEVIGLRLFPGSTKMIIRKNQPPAELVPKDLDLPDGRVCEITAPVTSIGRSPENDIVLEDLTVSRHHATIRLEDDGYYVHDSGSKNGTRVNGQTAVKRKIVDADRIRSGNPSSFSCLPISVSTGRVSPYAITNGWMKGSPNPSDQK